MLSLVCEIRTNTKVYIFVFDSTLISNWTC